MDIFAIRAFRSHFPILAFATLILSSCAEAETQESSEVEALSLNRSKMVAVPISGDMFGVQALISKCAPAVATISVEHNRAFPGTDEITTGAGVVVSSDGYVITCDHVVERANAIIVSLPDHRPMYAEYIGGDDESDIAILKIDTKIELPFISFGDSSTLNPGEFILAFGNPFNHSKRDAFPSISFGMVSALHRITFPENGRRRYIDAIQIDASINPGNSGGPLIDATGSVVGLVGVISSPTGYNTGVAFAIPSSTLKYVFDSVLSGTEIHHGYIGLIPKELSIEYYRKNQKRDGVLVGSVLPGQPGDVAGIRPDDIIVSIDGEPMRNTSDFYTYVNFLTPGTEIEIRYERRGREYTTNLMAGERPKGE
ncbi:MAG: trypsin-like peptidase domain-containing protein [Planctomycetes bacterium]|nr:trypsin-like peptidase domain-containing protein [Planctomycetota bacterium]